MQARVSRRVDALGLPAAVCCSSGRDETSAPVCRGSAGSVLVCVSCPTPVPDTPAALGGESRQFLCQFNNLFLCLP